MPQIKYYLSTDDSVAIITRSVTAGLGLLVAGGRLLKDMNELKLVNGRQSDVTTADASLQV
jgi:hypothetical protein